MRVALIQSCEDCRRSGERGDQNAFIVARNLRARGHSVTLLVPQRELQPWIPAFINEWRAAGFDWIPVSAARLYPPAIHFPVDYRLEAARSLASFATTFDVMWFFERHWAMPALRERRFRDRLLPVIVLDNEADPEPLPGSLEDINLGNARRYAAEWADAVLDGNTDARASVLSLEELFAQRRAEPGREIRAAETDPAVTVCIPYFEAPSFLRQTLQSLAEQTSSNFTVVLVDDGSQNAESRRVFDDCAQLYAPRGWRFVRQANGGPGAARNRAAREAETEFLLFLDSDDVAMPEMVERFLRAALLTGDDCLAAPLYGFREQPDEPCALLYDPPGNSLIGSMVDDMHGGCCMFVRREAFFSIGGFTEVRGVGFEDYEFHVRCNLHGLRWDVLPEYFYRYRMPQKENVSQSTPDYLNGARVRKCFEEVLRPLRLNQLPLAIATEYRENQKLAEKQSKLSGAFAARRPHKLKLLLLTCYFPFAFTSGWSQRVRAMIRYFGSRYELTLVTPMQRYEMNRHREVFLHIHKLRAVEPGFDIRYGHNFLMPARVRQQHSNTMRAVLQGLPTHRFHAAIIDQIFLAEFRKDIDTTCLLTEHNIESRILWQQAERRLGGSPDAKRRLAIEARLMQRFENRHWPNFPLRAVVSELDAEHMRNRVNTGKIVVTPNGADSSTWLSDANQTNCSVLFPAHLRYYPNIDAVTFLISEIWPEVRKRNAQAKLILAGGSPADEVIVAARRAGAELIANPQRMADISRRAALTVVPLRFGSGTRCKILESMAWGLPVVSTSLGCEGLDVNDGEHLLIRDDPTRFAEAVICLLSDAKLWQKLRNAGRELIRERYEWDRVFQPLETAVLELVS